MNSCPKLQVRFLTLTLFLICAGVGSINTAFAMPGLHGVEKFACKGVMVIPGEALEEVLEKCGEPGWRDVRTDVFYERLPDSETSVPVMTEEWIYEFGHSRLVEFLRFRDGRLVTIRSGNHGFSQYRDGDCGYGMSIELGDSKLEVITKCGEPTNGGLGEEKSSDEQQEKRRIILDSDEWMYNFGPDRLVHYLTFRFGRLMEVRSGGYGR